jgi:hypothetical protein
MDNKAEPAHCSIQRDRNTLQFAISTAALQRQKDTTICNRHVGTVPARRFELLPEVLELLIPHVIVGEHIGAAVFVDGIFDLGDYFALAL